MTRFTRVVLSALVVAVCLTIGLLPTMAASLPLDVASMSRDRLDLSSSTVTMPLTEAMPNLSTVAAALNPFLALSFLLALGVVAAPSTETPVSAPPKKTKARRKERSSEDVKPDQPTPIKMPELAEPLDQSPHVLKVDGQQVHVSKEYMEELAFLNEPIEIMIHPPADENGSPTTDLLSVGGVWAEVLVDRDGRFCESKRDSGRMVPWGYLPRGVKMVTKRKYVEQLSRAKHTTVRTEITDRQSERPQNFVRPTTNLKYPFQVFNDEHPIAVAWFYRILR